MRVRLIGALLLAAACARPATASWPAWLVPCDLPGVNGRALCGGYDVYEDRAAKTGRRIRLNVAVLPAATRTATDPIVFFAGGPGDDAVGAAPYVAGLLGRLRSSRDIVLVDQRGTGGSHPLVCELYSGTGIARFASPFMPLDAVRACRDRLSKQARLGLYTTSVAVDDVAEVLDALGYTRVNVVGGSYGTRVAQVFLRQHPRQVRTVILQGVTTMSDRIPVDFPRDAQAALEGILTECEATPDCRAAFPKLPDDVAAVFERARRGPIEVTVRDPSTGESVDLRLPGEMVGEVVRWMSYGAVGARRVPRMLHDAATGDWRPLAEEAIRRRRETMAPGSVGLYLSVTCAEDLPGTDAEMVRKQAAGTYLGEYRYREQRAACDRWVAGTLPPGFHDPVVSDAPVLLLSGALDPVTPPSNGTEVASQLRNGLHVIVPFGAHGPGGLSDAGCLARLQAEFVERGTVVGLDTTCVKAIRPPPFQ
jgi:pimeloyl-ACP methyl ester carboxylesterase